MSKLIKSWKELDTYSNASETHYLKIDLIKIIFQTMSPFT